jgi:uncharacterized membrane protein
MIITQAELTLEQFIPAILSGLVAVVGFFLMRYLARADRDRDELIRLSAFMAVHLALWKAIEELRQRK